MRHFFETVFYYCYLSYKKHDGCPEMRVLSTLTIAHGWFIFIMIQTICIYYDINLIDNIPLFCLSAFPFPLLYFIFYRMLYAKGKYKEIIKKHEPEAKIEHMERFKYYERAKEAFAVVYTTEKAQYANVILKKGCVIEK